jgi:hypothetical protein
MCSSSTTQRSMSFSAKRKVSLLFYCFRSPALYHLFVRSFQGIKSNGVCSTTGPMCSFATEHISLDSVKGTTMECMLSQLLPGVNKVVNALRLPTKAFIAGLNQRGWTPWSKPKHGFDIYHNNSNHTISFLIILK